MAALISLLAIVAISLTVVRVGAVALTMTGVSHELAVFQAQSAFSGAGFTTSEAESVVGHPVRRRIIRMLILTGNAGLSSAIASLVLTFYSGTQQQIALRLAVILIGLAVLWLLARSRLMNRCLDRAIRAALARWTRLEARDYARLLEIQRGYSIAQITIEPEDWLAGRTLARAQLNEEGVLVLGVTRSDGTYLGAPRGDCELHANDTLTCYGRDEVMQDLADRLAGPEGFERHLEAMREQDEIEEVERQEDVSAGEGS